MTISYTVHELKVMTDYFEALFGKRIAQEVIHDSTGRDGIIEKIQQDLDQVNQAVDEIFQKMLLLLEPMTKNHTTYAIDSPAKMRKYNCTKWIGDKI